MSQQIAIRLDEKLVAFVDQLVRDGAASSRALVVAAALAREQRRVLAEHDARILSSSKASTDLDAAAKWASSTTLDID